MVDQKNILIAYDFFYPAYKAGGPVQSLLNLGLLLNKTNNVSVITSAYDLNQKEYLDNIAPGQWNRSNNIDIFYLTESQQSFLFIKKLLSQQKPDIIYLNGMYSLPFVILPIPIWKLSLKKKARLIIAPRGMLQEGALKLKSTKKFFFLTLFKVLKLHKGVVWHATDNQEYIDVQKQFGKKANIIIAPNIPKRPLGVLPIAKAEKQLRLIYLSVISEKKNLHLAIKWLNEINVPIQFDICGPIKDNKYWESCQQMFNNNSAADISYKGEVHPDNVQNIFSNYHALLLPTSGENFGHAIYECLSVGRPVIISDKTPWNNVVADGAGFSFAISQEDEFKKAILQLYNMGSEKYDTYCTSAFSIANKYWNEDLFTKAYDKLFNN